jgi:flagellar basal-body rod protein FlgF
MDRLIYTAMTGASSILARQAIVANNLANVNTVGFRADTAVFRAVPVDGPGMATRTSVLDSTPAADFSQGPLMQTGRSLDVAVKGQGFIAVQAPDGSEAYTRAGNLEVAPDGTLMTGTGLAVVSDSGTIAIPPNSTLSIGVDGTVSAIPTQPPLSTVNVLGKIKLVNPETTALTKGADGLFRQKDGSDASTDPAVELASGALEGSNVSPADAMVSMIGLARQFEMHMRMIASAQQDAQQADQLLTAT